MVKARKKLYLEPDEVEVPRNRRPAAARVLLTVRTMWLVGGGVEAPEVE